MSEELPSPRHFARTPLAVRFDVTHLVSLHYFEFAKDYIFAGERHDFWELLYVDRGEIEVLADTAGYNLKQGDIIFHKPNEFHSLWANRKIAPNAIVVSFACESASMKHFENKIYCLDDRERHYVAQLMRYGLAAFRPPFDDPTVHDLILRDDAPPGSRQWIKIYLELLLLSLSHRGDELPGANRLSTTAKERSEDDIVKRAIALMFEHVFANLSLEEISGRLNLSQPHLAALFREKVGMSVVRYYKKMKIEQAKAMIREERHNMTEIAESLSYSSIHTFSRHFKNVTDMSPSEYARSVQARILS